jgi:hypothetical protein
MVKMDEVTSFMTPFGFTNIYDFIMSKDLNFKNIGNVNHSRNIIVGEELLADHEFNFFQINIDDGFNVESKINDMGLALNNLQKNNVRKQLVQVGIHSKPQYYIFISYEA